jgi:hypothetical protein
LPALLLNTKKSTNPEALKSSKSVLSKCAFRGSNPGHPD